jgi:hypothetical protein
MITRVVSVLADREKPCLKEDQSHEQGAGCGERRTWFGGFFDVISIPDADSDVFTEGGGWIKGQRLRFVAVGVLEGARGEVMVGRFEVLAFVCEGDSYSRWPLRNWDSAVVGGQIGPAGHAHNSLTKRQRCAQVMLEARV